MSILKKKLKLFLEQKGVLSHKKTFFSFETSTNREVAEQSQ